MKKVVVIGGGAGGMLAAGRAAECGANVTLFERNSILGKKLRLTGKGRGNITNVADLREFVEAFGPNGKFLYRALTQFSNVDLMELLDRLGVSTKVERGGRVFPQSDRASDVADALERWLRSLGVDVRLGTRVKDLVIEANENHGGRAYTASGQPALSTEAGCGVAGKRVLGVKLFTGVMPADAVVIATGGITYPRTGSTGDGYRMAETVGHTIVPPRPSLAALEVAEPWVRRLQGLSLRNVEVGLYTGNKKVAHEFGEMVFTHFGLSGPIILTLSKTYARLEDKSGAFLSINSKPSLTREKLDAELTESFRKTTKQLKNYLPCLLPRTLIPVFLEIVGVQGTKPVSHITKEERARMVNLLTDFRLTICGARPADEAIVTAGGVCIKEIDPRTMESKLVRNLYFAGEVIDIDATTGGFNLQAAFSTGWIAGESAAHADSFALTCY